MKQNRRTSTVTALIEALTDDQLRDIADHELLADLTRKDAPEAHPVGQMV